MSNLLRKQGLGPGRCPVSRKGPGAVLNPPDNAYRGRGLLYALTDCPAWAGLSARESTMMICETLPAQRRAEPARQRVQVEPRAADVAEILHVVSRELADLGQHFQQTGRNQESIALVKEAVELEVKAITYAATGNVRTTKTMASMITGLRSRGLVSRETLRVIRLVVGGKTPTHEDMRRLVELVQIPLLED